ncbi:hypothetical protein SAMN04488595_11864 [Ralstonia sp. 25mfcol4.1]|uniref:hypothetical protein n=1 Tax=Ralstonia sp. 25mfcol4.1 TaxID=1761899 RepID=UPI00048EEECC|nr:hypothetical protein [Ralstonia sp. 25mfcol4.1]SDP72565.1 hypothetical protein SAMN04488595_11864 [Ralstonia sp. 25mfcol4.1]
MHAAASDTVRAIGNAKQQLWSNQLQHKTIGTLLGTTAIILWYFPLVNMANGTYQAGQHIGGIAYLLFLASLGYAMLSWLEQHVPRIITAGVALGISLMFTMQGRLAAGLALYALVVVMAAAMFLAFSDHKVSAR